MIFRNEQSLRALAGRVSGSWRNIAITLIDRVWAILNPFAQSATRPLTWSETDLRMKTGVLFTKAATSARSAQCRREATLPIHATPNRSTTS
jgi:hypothetical protein